MSIENIFFIDVKTASQYRNHEILPCTGKELWAVQGWDFVKGQPGENLDSAYRFAGLYPEFGKIICITVAFVVRLSDGTCAVNQIVYKHPEERRLLAGFNQLLNSFPHYRLCCYNALEFDLPFIRKRLRALNMTLPDTLNYEKKKRAMFSAFLDARLMWATWCFDANEAESFSKMHSKVVKELGDAQRPEYKSTMSLAYWNGDNTNWVAESAERDVNNLVRFYCGMEHAHEQLVFPVSLQES